MSDEHAQLQTIFRAILDAPAIANGHGAFQRTLIVTEAVKDIKVSERLCQIHPEYIVEFRNPLDAGRKVWAACDEFDERRAKARAFTERHLRDQLANAIEACRKLGREDLIIQTLEAARAVPRTRSLVPVRLYEQTRKRPA